VKLHESGGAARGITRFQGSSLPNIPARTFGTTRSDCATMALLFFNVSFAAAKAKVYTIQFSC
jgi:hypothetical protein